MHYYDPEYQNPINLNHVSPPHLQSLVHSVLSFQSHQEKTQQVMHDRENEDALTSLQTNDIHYEVPSLNNQLNYYINNISY